MWLDRVRFAELDINLWSIAQVFNGGTQGFQLSNALEVHIGN